MFQLDHAGQVFPDLLFPLFPGIFPDPHMVFISILFFRREDQFIGIGLPHLLDEGKA